MDALCSAVPLSRLLFALAETRRKAVVTVQARSRVARLFAADGFLVHLEGMDGEPLGDALMRSGQLDNGRHGAALENRPPDGPIGRWLVEVGAAPRAAVHDALCAQLAARTARLLAQPDATYGVSPALISAEQFDVRVDLAGAVLAGLLELARDLPPFVARELAGSEPLCLTRFGARLERRLARAGCPLLAADVLEGAREPEELALRAVLRALGAASQRRADRDAYSLLLRKRGQVLRKASPAELLDLLTPARPADARRALRRLALKLHPDRFESEAPELRALSSRVMQALSRAEQELSARPRAYRTVER